MSISLSNAEILAAAGALSKLAQKDLPVIGALRVRKVMQAVSAQTVLINQVKETLLEKFGEHVDGKLKVAEGTGQVKILDLDGWNTDWKILMDETCEFGWGVRVSDLGNIDVPPAVLFDLGGLLLEEEAK